MQVFFNLLSVSVSSNMDFPVLLYRFLQSCNGLSALFVRFHLAATRGHLDCLNLILAHNVDVTATDASGELGLD